MRVFLNKKTLTRATHTIQQGDHSEPNYFKNRFVRDRHHPSSASHWHSCI